MATATVTRPAAPARTSATTPATPVPAEHTAGEKTIAALVIGSASALTVGVFAWAAWAASQVSIPI